LAFQRGISETINWQLAKVCEIDHRYNHSDRNSPDWGCQGGSTRRSGHSRGGSQGDSRMGRKIYRRIRGIVDSVKASSGRILTKNLQVTEPWIGRLLSRPLLSRPQKRND
jgi:hypothetical protein